MKRKVKTKVKGFRTTDGAGVKLVRVLGNLTTKEFDPILMLDSFDSINPDDYTAGFPMHPHRGIETISYVSRGKMVHRDSLGNEAGISDGEVQWMNSGSGIMHEEMVPAAERLLGVQLWLNLPAKDKMSKPSYNAVKEVFPTFLAYILSFIYVGIYWANHHHLINMTDSVSGRLLWKNLHWIFWMSLIPMATEWMGLNPYKSLPALFYGIILFMCAVSYNIVQAEVIKINGKDSQIFRNIGNDLKGKLSIIAYAAAIIFAFYFPVISYLIYIAIALTWIVPDSRLEKA